MPIVTDDPKGRPTDEADVAYQVDQLAVVPPMEAGAATLTFYVLNARDMLIGEYATREEAEARVEELRAKGTYGCHVVPPKDGYPSDLTNADLENRDAPDDEDDDE